MEFPTNIQYAYHLECRALLLGINGVSLPLRSDDITAQNELYYKLQSIVLLSTIDGAIT